MCVMASNPVTPCSLLRRILAISYDLMLLFSVLFFATVIILPVTGGMAVESNNILYNCYLLFWCYLYYAWQWVHGGQTLGMKAWHIRLTRPVRKTVDWKYASLRFLLAGISWVPAGAGFLWVLFDHDKLTMYDRYSKTVLIHEQT